MSPKKNAANANQYTVCTAVWSSAVPGSSAPGRNITAIITVTAIGEPTSTASVNRLRNSRSALRRVSVHH